MLVGVAQQQLVEAAAQHVDTAVDLGHRHRRLRRRLGQQHRLLADELALQRIASIHRLALLELGLLQLGGHRADLGNVILCAVAEHAHVAQAELLHAVLRLGQLLLVRMNLLLDEATRRVGVLALVAEARLHEKGQQRLHDPLRALRTSVRVRQHEEVGAIGRSDAQILRQPRDQCLALLRGIHPEIEVGHVDQLLDVGPADQGTAEHRDLLIDVGLHGEPRHQRTQHGLRVHMDARCRFVLVGHLVDHETGDHPHNPGQRHPPPAVAPHAAQVAGDLRYEFFHRSASSGSRPPRRPRDRGSPRG